MALIRLSDTDLAITPFVPQFTAIAHDTLGNFGEGNDGFDEIMAIPTSAFNGDVSAMSELDQHLLDMDFIDGQFAGNAWSPIGNDLQTFTGTGDTIVQAFSDTVTPPTPNPNPNPQPTPDPNPRPGGGGGGGGNPPPDVGSGGGGGGGGGNIQCTVLSDPVTHEYLGTACSSTGTAGGGTHGTLQQ